MRKRLNEFFYRLRWGSLESRRRRGLIRLHELLAGTEFADRYWMIMGLLLGCMRDGAPIPWDRDSDFGFLDRDLPQFLTAMRKLRAAGFNLRPPQVNNDGRTTMWTFKYQAVKYDFFLFDRNGANFRWYFHRRKPPLEIAVERVRARDQPRRARARAESLRRRDRSGDRRGIGREAEVVVAGERDEPAAVALDDDTANMIRGRELAAEVPALERAELLAGEVVEARPAQPGSPPIWSRSSLVFASMSASLPRLSTLRRSRGSVLDARRLNRQSAKSMPRPSMRAIFCAASR